MLKLLQEYAETIAVEAGKWIVQKRGQFTDLQYKTNHVDLVTEVDYASEAMIIKRIKEKFPHHLILSEEAAGNCFDVLQNETYCWVIDPLDGTMNFVYNIPHFAVSIGIVQKGMPVVGVVYEPNRQELFSAACGLGVTLNGNNITVSNRSTLKEALLSTGFSALDWHVASPLRYQFQKGFGRCRNIRILGAAALDLAYVAAGRTDGFWQQGLSPWDLAAGILLVQEAGGKVTSLTGERFQIAAGDLIASNSYIHDCIVGMLGTEV